MNFSDETLMAYADGELDPAQRGAIERAMRADPEVAAAVERHRALRAQVAGAYAGVLDEPVPQRLRQRAAPSIVSLDAAREARRQAAAQSEATAAARLAAKPAAPGRRTWARWGAIAASLVAGVLVGSAWLGGTGEQAWVSADAQGRLMAGEALAEALTTQLASEPGQGPVRIGTSFAARDGAYCRSFQLRGSAGLACHQGNDWRIPVFRETTSDTTEYRQAASEMPAAVLEAIDERIAGPALDAQAERAARERGWKR
ncbi:hypothetical protein [Massilia sp.]|uniref:anti-sigma factor n=1 Tax=Massilia sp. TaxID=1882437 RepID=UPI0028AC1A93|nr:hypothetical protein [Massilia sp.]